MTFLISAHLMTYDIPQKYCHAVGQVVMTSDHMRLTCHELKGHFEGKNILKPTHFEFKKSVQMAIKTAQHRIMITAPKAIYHKRRIVFTGNPHIELQND